MVDAPEKIWAVFGNHGLLAFRDDRQHSVEYTRSDLVAELEAENERLRKDAERYRALRDGSLDDLAVVRGLGVIDYGLNVVLHTYLKEIEGDEMDNAIDAARRALEGGPAPEAQQEPHEVLHVYDGDGGVIIRENGNISTFGAQTPAVHAAFDAASDAEAQQERSAEQAVTGKMVEAAQRIRDVAMQQTVTARLPECGEFGAIAQDADWLVDALKAAMEARNAD